MTGEDEPTSSEDHLGPALARRPLHMFWLLDVSGSMGVDGKIEALNDAMRVAIESTRQSARENPAVDVRARVITFAHDAEWHVADAVSIEDLDWVDVHVVERGTTELGRAIQLATEGIREAAQAGRGLPPALILVSDGKPTDLKAPSYGAALRELADEPWGRKASRMAIGIGDDADLEALHRFIGHDELPPLAAANAAELRHYLRWASTIVVDDGSRPTAEWHEGADEAEPASEDETKPVIEESEVPTEPRAHDLASAPTGPRRDLPPPSVHSALPPPPPPPGEEGPVW